MAKGGLVALIIIVAFLAVGAVALDLSDKGIIGFSVNDFLSTSQSRELSQPTTETNDISYCVDSDAGWNLKERGRCTDREGRYTDVCVQDSNVQRVREHYCSNNKCESKDISCTEYGFAGCGSGKCSGSILSQARPFSDANPFSTPEPNEETPFSQANQPGQANEPTLSMPKDIPLTYQGILEMLKSCEISTLGSVTSTCENTCNDWGKTCILGFLIDYDLGTTVPYECDWKRTDGRKVLNCVCCSTP
ncbi:MAG: hypothetical protein ABH817_02335 [archaeon]